MSTICFIALGIRVLIILILLYNRGSIEWVWALKLIKGCFYMRWKIGIFATSFAFSCNPTVHFYFDFTIVLLFWYTQFGKCKLYESKTNILGKQLTRKKRENDVIYFASILICRSCPICNYKYFEILSRKNMPTILNYHYWFSYSLQNCVLRNISMNSFAENS